jgi:hypothetical protein
MIEKGNTAGLYALIILVTNACPTSTFINPAACRIDLGLEPPYRRATTHRNH